MSAQIVHLGRRHAYIYAMYRPLDDETRTGAVVLLKNVDSHCRMLGMDITADTAKELWARLESPATATQNYQWLRDQVDGIRKLIDKEMTGKVFLYISPERAQYFTNQARPHLFGTDVANAFPSTRYDIYEAGVCAATGRGAATVFHLMRTLEIALTVLAAKFGVSMAHTNWAPAIEEIESKIREMHKDSQWKSLPDCKSQQEQYAQAASEFGVFKDAWRNYTMHTRGKYTPEEAEHIFESAKAFMKQLVKIGVKETP